MTRSSILAAVVAAALLATGCSERTSSTESADPQVIIPTETQAAPQFAAIDGYLIGADETRVLLRTQQGEELFYVREADLPTVGIGHLASHAGLTDIGFRVYYEESGKRKYLKGSEEIAPPF